MASWRATVPDDVNDVIDRPVAQHRAMWLHRLLDCEHYATSQSRTSATCASLLLRSFKVAPRSTRALRAADRTTAHNRWNCSLAVYSSKTLSVNSRAPNLTHAADIAVSWSTFDWAGLTMPRMQQKLAGLGETTRVNTLLRTVLLAVGKLHFYIEKLVIVRSINPFTSEPKNKKKSDNLNIAHSFRYHLANIE